MPTYSYRCTSCGHAFDIHQAFSDDTLTECPNCGGALRKVFSPVGVTFSGSGFYRTDSRAGSGSTGGASKDGGSSSGSGTSDSGSSGSGSSGSGSSGSSSPSTPSTGSSGGSTAAAS